MALPNEIHYQLNSFLKPRLIFDKKYAQFLINDFWLINIREDYFKMASLEIIKNINEHLKVGKQNKEFLNSLIQSLDNRLSWYLAYNIKDVNLIHKIVENIVIINDHEKQVPPKEKYLLEDIICADEDFIATINKENNYYFNLHRYSESFNQYSNLEDIEKVKLHYFLELHYECILLFRYYVDSLITDCGLIDFSKFDFDSFLLNAGFSILEEPSSAIGKKIASSLKKVDLANLFYFLSDEKIFNFHPVERQNQAIMKKFIEDNFTYLDDDNFQKDINNINKEFSKISLFTNSHLHKHFIDTLINQLETRRRKI